MSIQVDIGVIEFPVKPPKPSEIVAKRTEVDMTQIDLAKLLKVSVRHIQRWESGEYDMSPANWLYFIVFVKHVE